MSTTLTTNFGLTLPDPGTERGAWAQLLVDAFGDLDALFPAANWPTPPALGASSVNGTHVYASNSQQARYAVFHAGGRKFVWHAGRLVLSTKGGTISGNLRLLNLPFAAVNVTGLTQPCFCAPTVMTLNTGGGYNGMVLFTSPNQTYMELFEIGAGVAPAALTDADIGNTSGFWWEGIYEAVV